MCQNKGLLEILRVNPSLVPLCRVIKRLGENAALHSYLVTWLLRYLVVRPRFVANFHRMGQSLFFNAFVTKLVLDFFRRSIYYIGK